MCAYLIVFLGLFTILKGSFNLMIFFKNYFSYKFCTIRLLLHAYVSSKGDS